MPSPGDLVLVTGRAHERSTRLGMTEYPWSDQDAVRKAGDCQSTGCNQDL